MRALFLRSLIAAVLIGPAIGFAGEFASMHNVTKYDPPLSEAEFHRMGNVAMNEVEATLRAREIKLTRWEWLKDSIRYSDFWKHVAATGIVPGSGVFLGCIWVGWMERSRAQRLNRHPDA
jgi:hypothetical protein